AGLDDILQRAFQALIEISICAYPLAATRDDAVLKFPSTLAHLFESFGAPAPAGAILLLCDDHRQSVSGLRFRMKAIVPKIVARRPGRSPYPILGSDTQAQVT